MCACVCVCVYCIWHFCCCVFSFCCCFINVSVVWKATLFAPPIRIWTCAYVCKFVCVCVRVPCMLPVVWLFGRWRKPERKRHVCFCFQFIITRYFDDASGPSHHEKPVWCSMVCCVALHRIDNMSEWIWTALSNYRRFWSKSFLAIFGRVLHTNTHTHTLNSFRSVSLVLRFHLIVIL